MEKKEIEQKIKNLVEKIENILEKEIKKEEFDITRDSLNDLFNLIKEDMDRVFSLSDEISINKDTIDENLDKVRKESFFIERLEKIFFKLHFIVKLNSRRDEYILFKEQESFFIAYLIENFRVNYTIFDVFLIKLEAKKFNAYLEEYKLDETFTEKLKRKGILIEKEDIVEIKFFNCKFSSRFEEELLKNLLLESNLKKNKELQNKLKKLEASSRKLENSLNSYKLEGITILTIFVGIFTYLSSNFSIFQNLLTKNYIGNLFIIIIIFCIGLVPVVILFLLLKYLFLTPDNNKIIHGILSLFIFMVITIIFLKICFLDEYNKYYDYDLKKLNEKIEIQENQIKKLNDELNFFKNKNVLLQD